MANYVQNPCRTIGLRLTTTSVTALYECPASSYSQAIGVRAATRGSTATTLTIEYYNARDNNTYRMLTDGVVPGNGAVFFPLEAMAMDAGDEIRVQAGASNQLDVIITVAEIPGRSG